MPGLIYPVPHLPMLGKGSILLDVFDASGNPTGFQHLGNCTKLTLDIKDDIATLYQSLNKSVSLIASALKKREPSVTITGTDFAASHMALVMMSAGVTSSTTTVLTITGEALASATATKKGKYFRTVNGNLDPTPANTVVHQGAGTLIAGTDYVVSDLVAGVIYFPTTGAVVDTTAVTIDYKTVAGVLVNTVDGATQPYVKAHLYFDPDPTDGQKIAMDIWRVNFNPNGATDFIADDYGNWSLKGMILDDTANHPTSPYFRQYFL